MLFANSLCHDELITCFFWFNDHEQHKVLRHKQRRGSNSRENRERTGNKIQRASDELLSVVLKWFKTMRETQLRHVVAATSARGL